MNSNCLRSNAVQAQHRALPRCSISVQQLLRRPNGLSCSLHHYMPSLLASLQQHSSITHTSSIRAAAAPAVIPVSVAAASFPVLQSALAPALPYIMAAAAACCAALVALVTQAFVLPISWHKALQLAGLAVPLWLG
jgi:hypothetical protein